MRELIWEIDASPWARSTSPLKQNPLIKIDKELEKTSRSTQRPIDPHPKSTKKPEKEKKKKATNRSVMGLGLAAWVSERVDLMKWESWSVRVRRERKWEKESEVNWRYIEGRETNTKILNGRATVAVHICTVTIAMVHICTLLYWLMWAFFGLKCAKWCTICIMQDFGGCS